MARTTSCNYADVVKRMDQVEIEGLRMSVKISGLRDKII